MIIKRIKLENIRSYKEREVVFPEGSVLLSGDIGSGKTSVLLGIEFALFGLQPGQKGASLLRNGEDEGKVALEFELDGREIIIERSLVRGKTVSQDYAALTIDGSKKEMSVTELKTAVLELLDYPMVFAKKTNLLYKFTVYTPQEEMKQIILENPEVRLDTLRHLFGVEKYKRIKENAIIIAAKLREQVRLKQGQVMDIEEKKLLLESKQKSISELSLKSAEKEILFKEASAKRQIIEQGAKEVEERINEKRKFQQEVEKAKIMLAGKQDNLQGIEKEKLQLSSQIGEISKLSFDASKQSDIELKLMQKKDEKESIRNELIEILTKIKSINSRDQEAIGMRNKIKDMRLCPTCSQQVGDEYKQNIFRKVDEELKQSSEALEALAGQKQEMASKQQLTESEISSLEKQKQEIVYIKLKLDTLQDKKRRADELEERKKSLLKDVELMDSHILILKEKLLEFSTIEPIYEAKKKELDAAKFEEKAFEIAVAEIKKESNLARLQIAEMEKEIARKVSIRNQLEYLQSLETWISEQFLELISFTERNVMIKLREEFSKLFSQWFSTLVADNFEARLDEDFTPVIEQQGFELDYAYLSGGERTAIALAYRLALNHVINSLLSRIKTRNIVILDEPTDGFSEQQLDKMRDVLQQLDSRQLILVSHEQKIEEFVNTIIKFKKEGGVTQIEQGSEHTHC